MAEVTDNTATPENEISNANDPVIFKLSSPITSHRGLLHELTIKPIKGKYLIKYGSPLKGIKDNMVEYNYAAVMHIVAGSVDGLDDILIEDISARDLQPLARTVMAMCLPFVPPTTSK